MAEEISEDKMKATLRAFMERGVTDDTLKLTQFCKCMVACGLTKYKTTIESSVWNKAADAKTKKATVDQIIKVVIPAIGDYEEKMNKKDCAKIKQEICKKLTQRDGQKADSAIKVDATTSRLTDTKGYTGAHKERFGADGTGKGKAGREDEVCGSGYVGNYKNEGTYDKKK